MATESIERLLQGVWRRGRADNAPMPESFRAGDLQVDGIDVSVRHGAEADPGAIYVYVGFGSLPPDGRENAALRRLLEINLLLVGESSPTFCWDAAGDCVVLASRLPMDGLDPATLADTLAAMAGYAIAWRRDYFLGAPSSDGIRDPRGRVAGC